MKLYRTAKTIVCTTLLLILAVSTNPANAQEEDAFVHVQIKGKMETGIMAIGGETTGTVISAGNINWELDCSKNKDAQAALEKLNGKVVYVSGKLELKGGVEIRQRWIVHVKAISDKNIFKLKKKKQDVDDQKKEPLSEELTITKAQGGFAGFSGHKYTLSTDGSWKRQPFLNRDYREVDSKGKLNAESLEKVAEMIAACKLTKLPESLGAQIGANPLVYTVTYGKFQTVMTLPPGATDTSGLKGDAKNEKALLEFIDGMIDQMK